MRMKLSVSPRCRLSANTLHDNSGGRRASYNLEPLARALDDASPVVHETAFRVLSERLFAIPEANLGQLASPMLKRMLTVREPERLSWLSDFGKLASHLEDPSARERILLDTQERINKADSDNARATWLRVLGELNLAFDQPNEATAAFQKAIRLKRIWPRRFVRAWTRRSSPPAGSRKRDLNRRHGQTISKCNARAFAGAGWEQDVTRLAQELANRALDGYLPAYRREMAGPRLGRT